MNKFMEIRVESGRPLGRPRKTWLENVEADMAQLEIDREIAITGRNGECYGEEVQSNRKTEYKPIITGLSTDLLLQF